MMPRFTDAFLDEVRSRTSLVQLIGRSVALKRSGAWHMGLCPFHGERRPSFGVNERKGFWCCFGCEAKGDCFTYVRQTEGLSFVAAVEALAVEAGLIAAKEGEKPRPKPKVARPDDTQISIAQADTIRWCRAFWRECRPAAATTVEAYWRARGLDLMLPPTIRFHPQARHKYSGAQHPAMVAAIQGGDGKMIGVHRTFLKPDGSGKAEIEHEKMIAGTFFGGAVRLGPVRRHVALGEGIETSASVMQSLLEADDETGELVPMIQGEAVSVWAVLALANFAGVDLPEEIETVTLFLDEDEKKPEKAERLKQRAIERHTSDGRTVRVARPPAGQDFNKVLQEGPRVAA